MVVFFAIFADMTNSANAVYNKTMNDVLKVFYFSWVLYVFLPANPKEGDLLQYHRTAIFSDRTLFGKVFRMIEHLYNYIA